MKRPVLLTIFLPLLLPAASPKDVPVAKLWADLQSKREALPSLHQEFEVTRTFKTAQNTQSSTWTGQSLTLSAFKGKTVLLDFRATWCGPCRADGPALEKL